MIKHYYKFPLLYFTRSCIRRGIKRHQVSFSSSNFKDVIERQLQCSWQRFRIPGAATENALLPFFCLDLRTTNYLYLDDYKDESRWVLRQVTNDDVDEEGNHHDHVTRRWRLHRSVAEVRATVTHFGRFAAAVSFRLAAESSGVVAVAYKRLSFI